MTKSEEYKIKQAEFEIIDICREAGIDRVTLCNLSSKLPIDLKLIEWEKNKNRGNYASISDTRKIITDSENINLAAERENEIISLAEFAGDFT